MVVSCRHADISTLVRTIYKVNGDNKEKMQVQANIVIAQIVITVSTILFTFNMVKYNTPYISLSTGGWTYKELLWES